MTKRLRPTCSYFELLLFYSKWAVCYLEILYPEREVEGGLDGVGAWHAHVAHAVDGRQVLQPARIRLKLAYEWYWTYLEKTTQLIILFANLNPLTATDDT
jgi:hypothetical protein